MPWKDLLVYDPETGFLFWKQWKKGRRKSLLAGAEDKSTGYIRIRLDGKDYGAHRVIWELVTGKPPMQDIDHVNGVRKDNRWANLREASRSENIRNKEVKKTPGVYPYGKEGKWMARIHLKRKVVHLGVFNSESQAVAARLLAEEKHYQEFRPRRG